MAASALPEALGDDVALDLGGALADDVDERVPMNTADGIVAHDAGAAPVCGSPAATAISPTRAPTGDSAVDPM